MPSRKLRSPLALVVLGMLSEEPLHPYGMRQRIEDRAYTRLPGVKPTSLYDVVRRLESSGLIRVDETGRAGNRPERTRYAITSAGLQQLTGWVEEALADDKDSDGLSSALAFMYPLGQDRVVALLRGRLSRAGASLDADEDTLARASVQDGNPIFLSEHRFELARRRAEREWLAGFLDDLENGTLGWPTPRHPHSARSPHASATP